MINGYERRSTIAPAVVDRSDAALPADLTHVARSLHDQHDPLLGQALVSEEIQKWVSRFSDASIRTFVPLLVRRFAGAALREDEKVAGLAEGQRKSRTEKRHIHSWEAQ